jgi:cholesterol transport system auxiliary component
MTRVAVSLGLPLLLAGCLGLSGKPPATLLTLNASSTIASGAARDVTRAEAIFIGLPAASQALNVNRILVTSGSTEIAYVKDAQWAEPPARLFQRLLVETVGAKTALTPIDPRQFATANGSSLQGTVRGFGVAVPFAGATTGEAVVIYDAAFSRDRGQKISTRRFEARVPVALIDGPTTGSALNKAANMVASDVAEWLASR